MQGPFLEIHRTAPTSGLRLVTDQSGARLVHFVDGQSLDELWLRSTLPRGVAVLLTPLVLSLDVAIDVVSAPFAVFYFLFVLGGM